MPLFKTDNIIMDYGATQALTGIDFSIDSGEVHGLLGANGAGKSTLIKIIAGLQKQSSGEMRLSGRAFQPQNPADSMRAGIRVAHQELAVVPELTVRQNLSLGERFRTHQNDNAYRDLFEEWGIEIPLSSPMRLLSPALKAVASLSRSLVGSAPLILLDEPTSSLGPREVDGLFKIIRRRTEEGAAVLFVSHRLAEVSQLCSHATILRNGAIVSSGSIAGLGEHELAEIIAPSSLARQELVIDIGISPVRSPKGRQVQEPCGPTPTLEVSGLRLQSAVKDVSFKVMPGEIMGIAGLVGSGRTEVLESLMGLRKVLGGTISLHGEPFVPRNAHESVSKGIALVPEERATQALFPQRNIIFNCSSSRFRSLGRGWRGWRSNPLEYERQTKSLMDSLQLKTHSLSALITTLSGGNQQKVVLARVLSDGLQLLLLDEPTRGVDVGARRDFQSMIRRVADSGVAVVYVSSEFAELAFCDRIQVMSEGNTTVTTPSGKDFNEDELTRLCFIHNFPGGHQ